MHLRSHKIVDGMNEEGLAVGAFYLPGFTEYQPFDAASADRSLGPLDLVNCILTRFATIDEARVGLEGIRVVPDSRQLQRPARRCGRLRSGR
jgi:choloylglycine hydrolase